MNAAVDSPQKNTDLHFAFDIGHASLGWAVLRQSQNQPEILGSGVVTFPADDCLAKHRRDYRRQRRHIRATRQRIERMARLIAQVLAGSPNEDDRAFSAWLRKLYLETAAAERSAAAIQSLENPFRPHPAPWLLAARALQGRIRLTWVQLWDVLRWYAHNRGYDANRLWSRQSAGESSLEDLEEAADAEDANKVRNARRMLEQLGTATMAETIVKRLRIGEAGRASSSEIAYKTMDAAFPRAMVVGEVRRILASCAHLHGLNPSLIETLCAETNPAGSPPPWQGVPCEGLKLPARYQGGLLFGQIVPRFDNRIIGHCPATLAWVPRWIAEGRTKELSEVFGIDLNRFQSEPPRSHKESGAGTTDTDAERAVRWAERIAKKPLKNCREFLDFRFSELVANVRFRPAPGGSLIGLPAAHKAALLSHAREQGGFTKREFVQKVRSLTGTDQDNLDTLLMHPEAANALQLDPSLYFALRNEKVRAVWPHLDDAARQAALARWRDERLMNLRWFLDRVPALQPVLAELYPAATKRAKPRPAFEKWLRLPLQPELPSGRAPYSRRVMAAAARAYQQHPDADPRLNGGLLDRSLLRAAEESRRLEQLTNNHLIRQRLRVLVGDPQPRNRCPSHRPLRGLLHDLVAAYADGDKRRVATCTVEVARDLQEFSGKTKKEIEQDMGSRLKNFSDIVKLLEDAGISNPNAGLIRKARIADDLGWRCPYTDPKGLARFDAYDLLNGRLDKDHIIPRSRRASDSLDSLVITYPEVNRLKGNLTALEFIKQNAGKTVAVQGGVVTIASLSDYLEFVKSLAPEAKPNRLAKGPGHFDDKMRRWRRRQKLLIEKYEDTEKDFTPGDLTVSSHLMRMAQEQIFRWMSWDSQREPHRCIALPGQVTAEVRKAWRVAGCLIPACPEVRDPDDPAGRPLREKKRIRDITHLHHALDACVIGLTSRLLPRQGDLWQWIANRKVPGGEKERIHELLPEPSLVALNETENQRALKLALQDLPHTYKDQIVRALMERRVVQHVPADMSGARLEETTWSVSVPPDGAGRVNLTQRGFDKKDNDPETGARRRQQKQHKENPVNPAKLVGLKTGKLSRTRGARIIAANYGVVIYDAESAHPPEVIPHHQVWRRLREARQKNGGKPFRLIRNGQLIRVLNQPKRSKTNYLGVWRVCSIKNNEGGIALDITRPQRLKPANKVGWAGINVGLATLLAAGLEIIAEVQAIGLPSDE